jgi:ComEC/Rec2-related protein
VVRAAIMGALLVIATRLLGRPTFAPARLFTAAIAMTLINPFILWDVGFQLSFAATLGLMLYLGPWSQWTQNNLRRIADPETASRLTRTLSEVVLATIAAMLLTLPLILYHFERLSLISPIANLFILPAQPGVMIWGGLSTMTGMVVPAVGQLFAWVAWLFLSYTIGLVRLFASVPAASLPLIISPAGVAALYLIIFSITWLAWIGRERRGGLITSLSQNLTRKIALIGTVIIAILVVAWALSQPDGKLHVTFFDVVRGMRLSSRRRPAGRSWSTVAPILQSYTTTSAGKSLSGTGISTW